MLVLVGYPLVVAVLIAITLQSNGRDYSIALVNLDDSGRTVRVGDERLSVDDYVKRLEDRVEVVRLGPEEAEQALEDGRVTAVVTIPEGFVADLQSGIRQPTVLLETSRRTPVEAEAIEREIEAAVFRFNQALAADYVGQVLGLVDLVLNGGEISIFGVEGEALGLARAESLITDIQAELVARDQSGLAGQLAPILTFIDQTQANLSLARPAANAISSPIELEIVGDDSGRRALSALGVAAALVVSLGLVGSLLGAAGIASEREESTLARLRRGLASPWSIVGAKVAFAGVACVLVGLVLLGGTALLGGLAVGRWGLWLVTLLVTGLSFAGFGALIGAVAHETRTALLATLMVALPLVFVGFLPEGGIAVAAEVVPFAPASSAFQTLLAEPTLPASLGVDLVHAGVLGLALVVVAGIVLARRDPT
jgi:ABC-type multidrug transport system permease subunit